MPFFVHSVYLPHNFTVFLKTTMDPLNSPVVWAVTPWSSETNRRFRGTRRLHLQGQNISQARNQHDRAASSLSWMLAGRFGGTHYLHLQSRGISEARNEPKQAARLACRLLLLVSWLAYSSTLKMYEVYSSETLLFLRTETWLETFCVRSETLTDVVMKICTFWDVTPCSPLKLNQRYRGKRRLNLHGWRVSRKKKQHETGSKQTLSDFLMMM
jgi:hypothetical protein